MSEIILDISPNTHKNSIKYLKQMIDEVAKIDSKKHEVIFKHQLFLKAPPNLPLDRLVFSKAYEYAKSKGYKTTASVFDLDSLNFLMQYSVPFIKISCNPKYYWLMEEIPRKYKVYCSVNNWDYTSTMMYAIRMACVPEYPAKKEKYKEIFGDMPLCGAISDHTVGFDLWHEYKPEIYECHYVLHKNKADNPDSGDFAVTPDELRQIL